MNRNTGILVGALAAVLVLVLLAWPRGTDEQRIRRIIGEMREAVEEKSAAGVAEHLAADYRDAEGLGKQELRRLLISRFFQNKSELSCIAVPEDIEVAEGGRTATAVVWAAAFEGGSASKLELPENADAFRIEVKLKKSQDDQWQVVWHAHQQASVQDVLSLTTAD